MTFLSVEFAYIFLSIREVDKFFLVDCFVGFAVKFVYVTKVSYKLAVSLLVHFRHFEDISIHSAFQVKKQCNTLPTDFDTLPQKGSSLVSSFQLVALFRFFLFSLKIRDKFCFAGF